jgi:hypothetical protein
MSLLVTIRKEPRLVDGLMKAVGDECRLPNALAVALEGKGYCVFAGGKAHAKEAEKKVVRRSHRKHKQK